MNSLLTFTMLEMRNSVVEYVTIHAQNKLVSKIIHALQEYGQTRFLVVTPSDKEINEEDLYSLSTGWRLFTPGETYGNVNTSQLIVNIIKKFLSLGKQHICLFPSEFSTNSYFLKNGKAQIIQIDGYPYEILHAQSTLEEIKNAHNNAGGYFYNCLLMISDSPSNSWDHWLNEKYDKKALLSVTKCIIMEAYDNDSYVLILPEGDGNGISSVLQKVVRDIPVIGL